MIPAAVALAGGALWALCFGREALAVAPFVALVPLLLLLPLRRAPLLAYLHGLAFWLVSIYWIEPTLESYGGLSRPLAVALFLLLCAYLALFHLPFGWLGARFWRRGGAAAWLGLPALWVLLEWLRGWLFSGFPWNLAAYAWAEVPGALPLTGWIGSLGLSFLVVLTSVGLARAVVGRSRAVGVATLLAALLVLAWGARWAAPGPPEPGVGPFREVRLVQPDIRIADAYDAERVREDLERLKRLTRRACDRPGVLVIWPESAGWPYSLDRDAGFREEVFSLAAECPLLLNSPRSEGERTYNSAFLVGGDGVAARYDKLHLVPFGEFVPLARWVPFIRQLARNAGSFTAGTPAAPLPWRREELGVSICFEIIFPGEVAAKVSDGATLLVTITNDAWYGDTTAPWQHFRAARFRAAENRRPVLRAAITGVSGIIAADGSVRQTLGVMEPGVLRAAVAGRRDLTPFSRFPGAVPLVCLGLAAFAIFRSRTAAGSSA